MSEKRLLIPVFVGFQQIDLTPESVRLLLSALDDYLDGELPPDLAALCQLLLPTHRRPLAAD